MQTKTKQKQKNHIKESIEKKTWFDGKRQIPLGEMTDEHLRAAKLHAQRREETLFHACGQWAEIVNMLEKEAKNRGVRLRDLKTRKTIACSKMPWIKWIVRNLSI